MPAKEKTKIVLLDAHAIIHRAYHALPDFVSSKGEPTGGIYGLSSMLLKIVGDLKPDYIFACYDLPGPTYRHEAYEGYKAQRVKAEDELVIQLKRSRDVFKAFNIPIYDSPGFEADDILGTIVSKLKTPSLKPQADIDVVIASGDMDTLQLVSGKEVKVYTMKKGLSETITYDEEGVKTRFGFGPELLPDYKGLNGDPSDNIPGVPGIGEKTATILITKFGSIGEIYKTLKKDKDTFIKAGLKERIVNLLLEHEEEAEFSKELATIRRDAPIDFVLPEKKWIDSVEMAKITALFSELEFRTLGNRAREVLGKIRGNEQTDSEEKKEEAHESIPANLSKELAVAVSLINSNITDPKEEDIFRLAKTESIAKAEEFLFGELKRLKLERVFKEIEKPLIPVIEKMEKTGVKVDLDYLKKLSDEYHKKLSALEKKIWREAGAEFNINSPKQLGEVLFVKMGLKASRQKKTAGGALSTRESELVKLRGEHPIIEPILEYREFQKLLSTYIDNIPMLVALDGRLHTNFLSNGAATGRMSSRNPNLQNIPHKSELGRAIRKAFVAEKGKKLVSFDYSQIELRIAAFLSKDKKLIEIFKRGEDVHTAVAAEVFGVPGDKVHPEMRRHAKVINFGIIYGMGVNALRENLGTDRAEAQKFYNEYFEKFSGLAEYLDDVKLEAHKKGYTETFFGRRRYFEGLKSKLPYVRAGAERMAINAPIQGTEADIIKLAMVRIDEYLGEGKLDKNARMLLQVHDELVFEIEEDLVEKVVPEIQKIMESVISPEETAGIIMKTDASAGDNWAEMEKIKS